MRQEPKIMECDSLPLESDLSVQFSPHRQSHVAVSIVVVLDAALNMYDSLSTHCSPFLLR